MFRLADVLAAVGQELCARGAAHQHAGHVSDLKFSNQGHMITASVRGTEPSPCRVTAYVTRARDGRTLIAGYCDCDVGLDCEHVAATLLAVLEGPAAPPIAAPASVPERASPTENPALDLWLTQISETVSKPAGTEVPGAERVAYVFEAKSHMMPRRFPIDIVVQRLTKAQRWTKIRDTTAESLAAANARAVRTDDAAIGQFLQVYERTYAARTALAEELVRRIIATGRAYCDRDDIPALSLGDARPARIIWTLTPDGKQRPSLAFDDPQTLLLSGPVPWYVDGQSGRAGPIDAGLPPATLVKLLAAPALDVAGAKRVRETFSGPLGGLGLPPPLEVRERLVRAKPVPMLVLQSVDLPSSPTPGWRSAAPGPWTVDVARFAFAYGGVTIDPESRADELRSVEGTESIVYPRSRAAEKRFSERLSPFGFYNDPATQALLTSPGRSLRLVDERHWPIFTHTAITELRAAGWHVEIAPSFRYKIVDLADAELWHPHVKEDSDGWFDLAIGIDVGDQRVNLLAILRDLMQTGLELADSAFLDTYPDDKFFYVRLGPHDTATTLAFPAARLKTIVRTLIELGDPAALNAGGMLRLPRTRAAIVNELESASGLRWDVPGRLRELSTRLREFRGVANVAVPASFHGELRPYQRDGLDWLQFLASYGFGGILADDMGLGKSVQTLAHLLVEKESGRLTQPALLVVPTSLVHNWCDEAARFAPALRVLPLHGPARGDRFEHIPQHDLVITTYALLVRDAVLRERTWHAVILDEAQALKNPQAKVAVAAMGLHAAHRLCLTGTPVENHLGDLWSLFSIALPGSLGDRKAFGRLFRTPIEKRADLGRKNALAERIAPFLLRRTKEAVASELPEKTEIVQRVELIGAQRDLYESVRLSMHERVRAQIAQRGLARSQIVILDALLKLRQVCCDPRLLPKPMRKAAESVKLELLLEMLPQLLLEGRRVLVFSQFTSMLDLIGPALEARGIGFARLTGETKDRAAVVKRFTGGEVPVFLISLKAGGTGLNLVAADTVIHYDPWWNPAVERQATDRAHRIGQTRHVFVYKLIGAGTVEEKIVELQERKAKLAAAIFSENGATSARFAAEDVERLFAPLEA